MVDKRWGLLKIERQGNDLAARIAYRIGVEAHRFVLQVVGVLCVERVGKSEHKLQFGAKLEEGEVEVAAQSNFEEKIHAFHLQVIL